MPERQINITLGTAGHIDHGKTALVKLLTGCDTDRLKEEKERGMSIELGFAPCKIGGIEVGIVDVPGHEHFIKTMVAGATGIDGVILVIAADDGVMPQTREHFDILTLLGVGHGFIALTKIDRASAERIEAVRGQIAELVRGTFLEGAPVLGISNVTGEGFDTFYPGLVALVESIRPKGVEGVFRLPVERTFSVQGYGTVVTGIPVSGSAHVGDEVVLVPKGFSGRINAIQVYTEESDAAKAGQCAAINVRHWDHRAIDRGDVLTVAGYFEAAQWYACKLRLLAHEGVALKNGGQVKFHTGTSETPAKVYLVDTERMGPGEERFVQVRLDRPVVAGPGDSFIVRNLSPVLTVGGGTIIEATAARVKRNDARVMADLAERAAAITSEKAFVEYALKAAGDGATTDDLAHRTKVLRNRAASIVGELKVGGTAVEIAPALFLHSVAAAEKEKEVVEAVKDFLAEHPETQGIALDELREKSGLARPLFDGVLGRLTAAGRLAETQGRVSLPGHRAAVPEGDRRLAESIEALFRAKPFAPPGVDEAAAATGASKADAERVMKMLVESGRLVRLPEGLYFHGEAIAQARTKIVAFIEREGKLESVKFKYIIDTTRRYAIPLLDYFDRIGVTLRVGNTRYLKGRG